MKHIILTLLLLTLPLHAKEDGSPTKNPAKAKELTTDRSLYVYHHGVNPAWGDAAPQQDTFVVMHPKAPCKQAPLYFYWGPFGHANNHANIMKVNDLINSFDWLDI
ncbi:MAG: hypothetical protein ACI9QL_005016 [Candidatus Omnitrophota bacterium]|jgi:hypothetical protein